ncbi:hypothetical protein [Paraburkholderia dilworthii]|uniref:hypothetical protein n=1 Tax=Paraburkholderia dilworthii TaxID=948106 RepID=UPI00040483D2|nr:hypothetical protein [Paraburkholderia dilworthii]
MALTAQSPGREKANAAPVPETQAPTPRAAERARRAVAILREQRKSASNDGVTILKETLDRLEDEVRRREAERGRTPRTR